MKEYVESRLPNILIESDKYPQCGETEFNVERKSFLYFTLVRCSSCGWAKNQ